MNTVIQMMNELIEFKDGLKNDYLAPENVESEIEKIERQIDLLITESSEKNNALKSLMIVFNRNNYSDMTVFFSKTDGLPTIIEITGDNKLCEIISDFIKDDPEFYSNIEKLEISGEYYRVFAESMSLDNVVYTVLSMTLSKNFRSSDFHMLCDIIMDYTKSSHLRRGGIFCDLFDDTLIEMNRYISDSSKPKPLVYYFRYEYITDFFQKIGLATIIEMSDGLKVKLMELFGDDSYIIRISLSSYVVIALDTEDKRNIKQYLDKNKINFIYKGIVLPYMVIQIPYKNSHSSYDIFENVYLLDNYLRAGDVRI